MTGDFWGTSGHHLLARTGTGGLAVTDDFLRAYLGRPELRPVEDSCPAEVALHHALMADPRRPVPAEQLGRLADPDARENYEVVLRFRDLLTAHQTVEGSYQALFRGDVGPIPPMFVDQLVHVILRNMLDGCGDPVRLRAAETLFRAQKVSISEDRILLADEETVELHADHDGAGPLLAAAGAPQRVIDLDILGDGNLDGYWDRSDRFDMALDVGFARPGLDALCRVLEQWVRHFAGVAVSIQPVQTIRDERWAWHVGLDAEATGLLNALWHGEEPAEADIARILSLFRLDFADPADMLARVAGRPVYMAMAMTPGGVLRLKPQNLLTGLPFGADRPS